MFTVTVFTTARKPPFYYRVGNVKSVAAVGRSRLRSLTRSAHFFARAKFCLRPDGSFGLSQGIQYRCEVFSKTTSRKSDWANRFLRSPALWTRRLVDARIRCSDTHYVTTRTAFFDFPTNRHCVSVACSTRKTPVILPRVTMLRICRCSTSCSEERV